MPLLKKAIREELASEIRENRLFEDWVQFEYRVDELAPLTFDIYMECREKVYGIRINEVKAETEMALKPRATAALMMLRYGSQALAVSVDILAGFETEPVGTLAGFGCPHYLLDEIA